MQLYIDPGTGSMLFTILIGILGAAFYVIHMFLVKVRFILSGGKKVDSDLQKIPFVIFSDHKRYWNVFEPICRRMNELGYDVLYLTASADDPVFECNYEHIKAEFAGENNKPYARLNFINASICLSTTPGLDVYQWKRSKNVDCYIHILHAANDVTGYRMFGLDYYDAVMLSGEYQVRDIRNLEKLRELPPKDLAIVGIPYMDEMVKRLNNVEKIENKERTVLLASSWGASSVLNRYGERIIDALLSTGYKIIVRPHPQSFTSEKDMIERLMKKYPESDRLEWNMDNDNFEVLRKSDIMISDFSGVIFDFTLVYDKPVIYADTSFDDSPYDAWWLDTPYWGFSALPKVGEQLTNDNISRIKDLIDNCIEDSKYELGRKEVRNETWQYQGEGTKRAVDFILKKYNEVTKEGDLS